jgi:hypothetical protein
MPTRMALFVTVIFTVSLAAVSMTVRASRAADECLTKPNAAAPPGSHWYYRVDRTTHRECWYLGAEGGKVRQHALQDASAVLSHPSKMSTQPAPQIPAKVANAEVGAAEATRTEIAPVESTSGQAKTPEDNSTATLSTRWSDIPTSTLSIDHRSVSVRDSYAEEKATTELKDEMPISPILSPAELAERPPEIPTSLARLAAVLAAVLGLAAMVSRMIFKLSAARRPNRSDSRDQRGLATTRMHRSAKQAPPIFAKMTAAAHQAGTARRTGRALSSSIDPVVDIELSVRRLLRELQRRQRGHARQDSKRTLRKVAG